MQSRWDWNKPWKFQVTRFNSKVILKSKVKVPQKVMPLLCEIKKLATSFVNITFAFVYRESNSAADCLARKLDSAGFEVLNSNYPIELVKILNDDGKETLTRRGS